MKIFITEFFHGARSFEGPRIFAADWAHAERQARELGVELVGELGVALERAQHELLGLERGHDLLLQDLLLYQ